MKESLNLAIRLFIITGISALVLAFANKTTSPIIAASREENYQQSLKIAFEDADSFEKIEDSKLKEVQAQDETIIDVQAAMKDNQPVGYVYQVAGKGGYSGDVVIVLGVNNENNIVGYQVLESQETPGIGDRVEQDEFVNSVIGKSMNESILAVKSPSADNEIQAISGATYSTGAVTSAINSAQKANQMLNKDSTSKSTEEKKFSILYEKFIG